MNYCLYHKNCADGFGAAFAVWTKYGDENWEYKSVQYGDDPPPMPNAERIMIVDFSFSRAILKELEKNCLGLVVIDHHKTAQEVLLGYENAIFDMEKSGAVLTFEYLFGDSTPELLKYIQDRDLWKWELPFSKEINLGLSMVPMTFEGWKGLSILELKKTGMMLLGYQKELIDRAVKNAFDLKIGSKNFRSVNSCILQSEICDELLKDCDWAACFYTKEGYNYFSLRSRGDNDVSKIALEYGGGGHRNAAGMRLRSEHKINH